MLRGCFLLFLLTGCDGSGTTWLGEELLGSGGSSAGSDSASGGQAAGSGGEAGETGLFFQRYEAESVANTLTYAVQLVDDNYVSCSVDGVREGAECTSGGKAVRQTLGRSPCEPPTDPASYDGCQNLGGGIAFNEVRVPDDAMYDVTWWYHCGEDPRAPGRANVYGDTTCGGLDYETGEGTGCRSHLIDVNGAAVSATIDGQPALYFHFPCYVTTWSVLHGATTRLPLKAGANTIYIHAPAAPTLDAADIDAIDVQTAGGGVAPSPLWPKLVTPVLSGN